MKPTTVHSGPEGAENSGLNFEFSSLRVAALVCLVICSKLKLVFLKSRYKKRQKRFKFRPKIAIFHTKIS